MSRSIHKCNGGDKLTTIGACWFVSYLYNKEIDSNHLCWENVNTCAIRKSAFLGSVQYHSGWLDFIINMNDKKLNQNNLGLTADKVKSMARKLISEKK